MNDDDNHGSELSDTRWWWLGPGYRKWSDAELKALPRILGVCFFTMIILALLPDWAMTTLFHRRPLWIAIPSGAAVVVLSGYFSTAVCRTFWPVLFAEAEANYSKTMGEIHRRRRKKDRS